MIKLKLIKAIFLGLCMSALSTGVAFAQSDGGSSPAFRGDVTEVTDKENALYEKQREIDQYVFVDYAKEIQAKGFEVVYTGVAENHVEIGITPYDKANAIYLYDIFGTDVVKVVESEKAVLYTTMDKVPDNAVTSEPVEKLLDEAIYTTMELSPDTPVSRGDVVEPAANERVYKDGQEAQIEIDAINEAENLMDPDVIFQTTVADEEQEVGDVKIISADDSVIAENNIIGDTKGLSAPIIILLIAAGAVLIGGVTILTSKKKTIKQ